MMMIRAALAAAVVLGLIAGPLGAEAQQAGKLVRIGLLDYGAADPRWNAFRERLRELGYVEGQHVIFEPRWGTDKWADFEAWPPSWSVRRSTSW
jgi:hypothetical protein